MRFAHFSDTHLGFQKSRSLQELEQRTFDDAMDQCIQNNVDFILMCGDMFHTNIPDLRVQLIAMRALRRVYDAGIPVYMVHGSHDSAPNNRSAIDLLEAAGYLINITKQDDSVDDDDGLIHLKFVIDEKTGTKLAGLPGLKVGRDIEYYKNLDRNSLENEDGFKIFLFHGAISEAILDEKIGENMPLSLMPAGFDYYAGGHLHTFRDMNDFSDHPHVVYPGTLLAGYHSDMEENAKGVKRGFVMVDFDERGITDVRLVPSLPCEYAIITIDAENKTAESVQEELKEKIDKVQPSNRIVITRMSGQMSAGRTTDINMANAKKNLRERGALDVLVTRHGLSSTEYSIRAESGSTIEETEKLVFQENIGQVQVKRDTLSGDAGIRLADDLLGLLRQPRPENEKVKDYKYRMTTDALARMGL